MNRRRKGRRFEQEIARELGVKRGFQFRGGAEAPDVDLPGWWLECKRQRRPNILAAYLEAIEASRPDRWPAAVTKADRGPVLVTMSLGVFKLLLRAVDPAQFGSNDR
jgi:hypothetical protein